MADASDSKSDVGDYVWVQVPSPAWIKSVINIAEMPYLSHFFMFRCIKSEIKKVYTFLHE